LLKTLLQNDNVKYWRYYLLHQLLSKGHIYMSLLVGHRHLQNQYIFDYGWTMTLVMNLNKLIVYILFCIPQWKYCTQIVYGAAVADMMKSVSSPVAFSLLQLTKLQSKPTKKLLRHTVSIRATLSLEKLLQAKFLPNY